MDLIRLVMVAAVAAVDCFIPTFLNDVPLDAYGRELFKKVNSGNETVTISLKPSNRKAGNKINTRTVFSQNGGLHQKVISI